MLTLLFHDIANDGKMQITMHLKINTYYIRSDRENLWLKLNCFSIGKRIAHNLDNLTKIIWGGLDILI